MASDGQNIPEEIPQDPPSGQPGSTGKTKDEWWAYALRKLGGGIIDVELTNDHKKDCLDDTDRWFAERVGFVQYSQLPLIPGQSNYYLSSDIIEVYDVWLPNFQIPTMGGDTFSYSAFNSLFGSWASPQQSPMPYSDVVQRLQYLETVGRIFTTDRDYDWQPELRRLVIMPPPQAGGSGSLVSNAIIKAGSATIVTEQLDPRPGDFYRRKLLIEAMRTLGQIRDTYDAYPTVGGERTMNGGALIQRADQLEGKLEQDVINHERSCPIISG